MATGRLVVLAIGMMVVRMMAAVAMARMVMTVVIIYDKECYIM